MFTHDDPCLEVFINSFSNFRLHYSILRINWDFSIVSSFRFVTPFQHGQAEIWPWSANLWQGERLRPMAWQCRCHHLQEPVWQKNLQNHVFGYQIQVWQISTGWYRVFFYGTHETANLKSDEMWPYNPETRACWNSVTNLKLETIEKSQFIRRIE